eukprot:GGOE01020174.1.p1 GENE.GGOE01020174.1~~GGOE01020174.1.p1  ORF type:complete len:323 (-),score=41.44 GGOE01020174.1:186-1154(-)
MRRGTTRNVGQQPRRAQAQDCGPLGGRGGPPQQGMLRAGQHRPPAYDAHEPPIKASPAQFIPEQPVGLVMLVPCGKCGRNFAADRIRKHEDACQAMKKRKKFDVQKQRWQGLPPEDLNLVVKKGKGKGGRGRAPEPAKPKSTWRQAHKEFQEVIKYSRVLSAHEKAQAEAKAQGGRGRVAMKGGKGRTSVGRGPRGSPGPAILPPLPPPPISANAHYVQCPHCTRSFAPDVAERHVPKCKTTLNRPKPPPGRTLVPAGGLPKPLPAPAHAATAPEFSSRNLHSLAGLPGRKTGAGVRLQPLADVSTGRRPNSMGVSGPTYRR